MAPANDVRLTPRLEALAVRLWDDYQKNEPGTAFADPDLSMTLDSGQVFHWDKTGTGFVGTIGDLPLLVEQRHNRLEVPYGAMAGQSARARSEFPP